MTPLDEDDPMFALFTAVSGLASQQHGAVASSQLDRLGVGKSLRYRWVRAGLLQPAGPRSYFVAGSVDSWRRQAWAAAADVAGRGYVAGRTAAHLHRLDGFASASTVPEVLVRREHRSCHLPWVVHTTGRPLGASDTVVIDGIRCLSAERLIVESPLFGFTVAETENAIDSAVRGKRVHEQRLRKAVLESLRPGVAGEQLREALIDTGGESRLERWFLAIVRRGGLARPTMRVAVRSQGGWAARLDALFPGRLVIELEGHATHSLRRQRQHDEERRTKLILKGYRVITFTYNDVRDRPDWVLARLREAIALAS